MLQSSAHAYHSRIVKKRVERSQLTPNGNRRSVTKTINFGCEVDRLRLFYEEIERLMNFRRGQIARKFVRRWVSNISDETKTVSAVSYTHLDVYKRQL